jgi:hypothetical protein
MATAGAQALPADGMGRQQRAPTRLGVEKAHYRGSVHLGEEMRQGDMEAKAAAVLLEKGERHRHKIFPSNSFSHHRNLPTFW